MALNRMQDLQGLRSDAILSMIETMDDFVWEKDGEIENCGHNLVQADLPRFELGFTGPWTGVRTQRGGSPSITTSLVLAD